MDLAWLLSPPWDWVGIAAALGVVGGWGRYDRWLEVS